jgi:hypothetical protein
MLGVSRFLDRLRGFETDAHFIQRGGGERSQRQWQECDGRQQGKDEDADKHGDLLS